MSIWILSGLALMNLVQVVLIVRLSRRVSSSERVHERLAHFAEALTLLTDTTEAGLSSVANGLNAFGQKAATRSTTRATSRRIVKAAKSGMPVASIAADEAMSESEIRLHLELNADTETSHGAMRI